MGEASTGAEHREVSWRVRRVESPGREKAIAGIGGDP